MKTIWLNSIWSASSSQQSKTSAEVSSENFNTEPETESGKMLVVYYSASGNTNVVAGYIANATSADLFELVPVNPYSDGLYIYHYQQDLCNVLAYQ